MPTTQPETLIVRKIKKTLTEDHGCAVIKIHGGPYQQAGLPDLLVLDAGRAMWLEVKTATGKPTKLQLLTIRGLERTGGTPCFIVRSVDEAIVALEATRARWRIHDN